MRFTKKNAVLRIIESLRTLNAKLPCIQELEQLLEVLSLCQESAMEIGNTIEEAEDYPEEAIFCLEDYCEFLYQLSLQSIETINWTQELQKNNDVLDRVQKMIQAAEEEPAEVVFLPYKASMWDALHTVYEAAKKDSRFHVSVVPVPYYTLTPDDMIDEERYEAEEFAEYVEVTDYLDYPLEEIKPDIIFIHNPYDEFNKVTRLHERYFSTELVRHTEHLVYIPYYVKRKYAKNISMAEPGARNAWKIIVQSEIMRQQYIMEGIPAECVAGLGSPKFDMMIKAQINPPQLPEEWNRLKGKRIYFLNTHLAPVIYYPEIVLEKIQTIMDLFETRQDIVLLWRPHPLTFSSLRSLKPEMGERYEQMVKRFKDSNHGVYDDSSDPVRALALADAYIGGWNSSVAHLYQITGKPMYFLDDDDSLLLESNRSVRCRCAERIDGKVYMYSWEYNALCIFDEKTGEITLQKGCSESDPADQDVAGRSIVWKSYIYFIPKASNAIIKYDTRTSRMTHIDLDLSYITWDISNHNFEPVIYESWLYLLPVTYMNKFPYIALSTDQIGYIETDYRSIFASFSNKTHVPIFWGTTRVGDCVWRACELLPYIQKYHLNEQRFEYVKVAGIEAAFSALTYDGTYFWLAMHDSAKLIQWDARSNQVVDTLILDNGCIDGAGRGIKDILYYQDSIWVIPRSGYRIIKVDLVSKEAAEIDCDTIQGDSKEHETRLIEKGNYRAENGCIYIFPYKANGIITIHCDENTVDFQRTEITSQMITETVITENTTNEHMLNLEEFVDYTATWNRKNNTEELEQKLCGEKIWNYIVDNL